MKKVYVSLLFVFLLGGVLISLSLISGQASAPAALNRPFDPIVISGDQLPDLLNIPVDQIFVYAFAGSNPVQIPAQIDERNANGMFVPIGNGLLDSAEELVFMAADAGDWTEAPTIQISGQPITPTYVLTLTDPLSSDQAWAYIYSSALISQTFSSDYIDYISGSDQISSTVYTTGFEAAHGFRDYLTLGSGPDLLDREKFRISGYVVLPSITFSVNEDDATLDAVHALDGPVRVTRVSTSTVTVASQSLTSSGATFFYPALIVQFASLTTPASPVTVTDVRISTDLSASASGAQYNDINNTGISVDGVPDTIVTTPAADWLSVSFVDGMFTTAAALPGSIPNTSTYYKDDSTVDPTDTGDQMSYGDVGLAVSNPPQGQSYDWLGHIYMQTQPGGAPATHYQYYLNPISVEIARYAPPGPPPTPTYTPTPTLTPTVTLTPSITPTPTPTGTPIPGSGVFLPLLYKDQ